MEILAMVAFQDRPVAALMAGLLKRGLGIR
jgi:hypothetical protein